MNTYGKSYDKRFDKARIGKQMDTIRDTMLRSQWMTLGEIERATGYGQASISAQLRHLRKPEFGSYIVEKRNRGERYRGLFEYRVLPPKPKAAVQLELLRTA